MKHTLRRLASAGLLFMAGIVSPSARAQSDIWVTAYYAGWMQGWSNNGRLPAQNIDFAAMTHIVHFSLTPRTDGTVNPDANSITLINSQELVTRAHAAGTKVIISIGGWGSDVGFRGATSSANRAKFISNLISFAQARGYDGIDIDWERLESSDATQYVAFINELRQAIDAQPQRLLLTAAVAWHPAILAQVHTKFDQINIMTYDLSGAWPGWITWHNAPIYDGGTRFPSGGLVPSIDGMTNSFIASGVPASKIGIGIDFYGYVWSGGSGMPNGGATDPRQSWSTAPTVQSNVPYYTIMDNHYQQQYYRWDNSAQVSYLRIDNAGSASDKFISYDDEETARKKIEYARAKGIGGVIIWELGGGVRTNLPAGQQDPLLQAVKQAFRNGSTPSPDTAPPAVSFSAPDAGSTVSGLVTLAVNATDNVGVVGVQFKVNGAQAGNEVTSAPYSVQWNSLDIANGSVTLSAVARDAAGNQVTATRTVTLSNLPAVDTTPPTVAFASPANGATVSGTISLQVTANDNVGVAGVQFTLNGSNLGSEVTSAPYTLQWNTSQVSAGTYSLGAVARDASGNRTTAGITLTVGTTTTPPPSANTLVIFDESLQAPWINNSWSATVAFNSTEQASGGASSIKVATSPWGALSIHHGTWGSSPGVNGADYGFLNLDLYAVSSGTSISIFFENDLGQSFPKKNVGTVAAGSWSRVSIPMNELNPDNLVVHRISVQELSGSAKTFYVDGFGFGGSLEQPSPDTVKPVVALTAPSQGATVSGTITVTANATDNKGVAGVRFLLNGSELAAENATAPYSLTWNTTSVPNGSHTLTASARDASNNVSSVSVTITVSNTATPPASSLVVYEDVLSTPWINASWNATVAFSSTEKAFSGPASIKVVQNAWGALRLHSGPWGQPSDVSGSLYDKLEFAVYGGSVGVSIGVYLENDLGQSFPSVQYQWVNANQWKQFAIPMSILNPGKQVVHRIVIQDLSGRQRTYFVDRIRFTSGTSPTQAVSETAPEPTSGIPEEFGLGQNFPNPFNPTTTISYSLPFDAQVTLEVFNLLGERVALLVDAGQKRGRHSAHFDAGTLASGSYIYRLQALPAGSAQESPLVETRRMVLMK